MPPLLLEGEAVKRVNSTKFLGVYVDENLNWNCQINEICLKLSRICGVLYRIRNSLTTEALSSVHYTLCYPHLIYGVCIWACMWPSFLNKVTVTQKKILRCMFFKRKFDTTEPIFTDHKILKFSYIHKYFLFLFMFKIIRNFTGTRFFRLVNRSHNTRSNNVDIVSPKFRTTLFKHSILSFATDLWNSLPVEIKKKSC